MTSASWRDVWTVVRTSAERRLGRPLLLLYGVLLVVGVAAVTISIVVMYV